MRTIQRFTLLLAAAGASCFAQQWEFGGGAGFGVLPSNSISSTLGAATTGFQSGAAFGAYAGQNLYRHIGGELAYGFMQSNLKLSSGSTEATFSGVSHVLHYDILFHTAKKGSRVQYFVAVGGGMKIYKGTGTEAAYQPLSQYAYFTKTTALKPMGTVGAGMKYALTPHMVLRTEFRDFITPFPETLIAPAPQSKIGGLVHNFVPMVSIAYEY